MSGPIQTIPQGLLGLLQLKQTGRNPGELLETVQPTFELSSNYLQRAVQNEFGLFGGQPQLTLAAPNGHGQFNIAVGGINCVVPQTETWYLDGISAFISSVPAADTVTAGVYASFSNGGGTLLTSVYADVISARARTWLTPPIFRPLWLPPSTAFFLMVTDYLTAAGLTVLVSMKATRIPI